MRRLLPASLWIFLLLLAFAPCHAAAHAVLIGTDPPSGSRTEASPEQILLTFNERIEQELFLLQVRNSEGTPVTKERPVITAGQRGLQLKLPALGDGYYTVSYRVISADSHPVEGSYVFTVGPKAGPQLQMPINNASDIGHYPGGSDGTTLYLSRIAAYLGLLGLSGWVIWRWFAPRNSVISNDVSVENRNRVWGRGLQLLHLTAQTCCTAITVRSLLPENASFSELSALLTQTITGISMSASLVLAFLGLPLLFRSIRLDFIWVAAALAAKSFNGHAAAAGYPFLTLPLDLVHLSASAVWAGGLLYMLVHLLPAPGHVRSFMPVYSRAALISFILLALSGLPMALMLQPDWTVLHLTLWGRLLLIKTALVLLAGVIAFFIRLKMRKNRSPGVLLRIDFAIMVLIVAIVGIFTRLSPAPQNKPLSWTEHAGVYQVSANITPNAPGVNRVLVRLESPEDIGPPKYVQVYFSSLLRKEDIPPLEVPLRPVEAVQQTSTGPRHFEYESSGPFLPFAGKWELEIRVMNAADDETVLRKQFMIYN